MKGYSEVKKKDEFRFYILDLSEKTMKRGRERWVLGILEELNLMWDEGKIRERE